METNWENEYKKLTESALQLHELYKDLNLKYEYLLNEYKKLETEINVLKNKIWKEGNNE
jgi:hypothetical protein